MNNQIIAINKKYQSLINKCYRNYRKYHELVNNESSEQKQADKFDIYLECLDELPKREQVNFNKQHFNIHGYT